MADLTLQTPAQEPNYKLIVSIFWVYLVRGPPSGLAKFWRQQAAITELDKIPHDVSLSVHCAPPAASTSSTPWPAERMTEQDEHNVSASAPPVSTTKGSRKKYARMIADIPQPHFQWDKRKKQRKCGRCGTYDTGHNAATCERA
jgi:hypothetical protein